MLNSFLFYLRIKTVYEEPAKLSTTRATSKNSRTSKNKSESSNKVSFKRIPAKRVPRRKVEYLTGKQSLHADFYLII